MRTANIGELKNQLSGYLQCVKNGEEIVVREREAHLVASGALKMPEEVLDWDGFFLAPAGNVSREIAIEAALESRGDW